MGGGGEGLYKLGWNVGEEMTVRMVNTGKILVVGQCMCGGGLHSQYLKQMTVRDGQGR